MKLEIVKTELKAQTRKLKANWTVVWDETMEIPKQSWRDVLSRERGTYFKDMADASYEPATKRMQQRYPGNYIVEEYYNNKKHTWDLRLKFDTPEDETWFMLKYE